MISAFSILGVPQGWQDQGFQCVTVAQGTCCIDQGYDLQPHNSLMEYCFIDEVKNTEWYDVPNHCPHGFGYGEEYTPMGQCKQWPRKHTWNTSRLSSVRFGLSGSSVVKSSLKYCRKSRPRRTLMKVGRGGRGERSSLVKMGGINDVEMCTGVNVPHLQKATVLTHTVQLPANTPSWPRGGGAPCGHVVRSDSGQFTYSRSGCGTQGAKRRRAEESGDDGGKRDLEDGEEEEKEVFVKFVRNMGTPPESLNLN